MYCLSYLMPEKPNDIFSPTIHTYWDSPRGLECPLCGSKLQHAYNNGGRRIETLKGSLWVITNYYACLNRECEMHQAFPAVYPSTMNRKRFSLDVWAKVIQHHFKHHMNYSIIEEVMWDDWELSISKGTIKHVCEYFQMAGKQHVDDLVLKSVRSNGRIVLSLDGAQPVKNEPSLWIFSDRLTGHVLSAKYLESAPAPVLKVILKEIERQYGVPIAAVISDKQRNIVNAVKSFNPEIPHAFCHYHFLKHVAEPIASKDSHLKTTLKKAVRQFSIVMNKNQADSNELYRIFLPVSEELKCAISTKGNRFDIFPGIECYANLEHVHGELEHLIGEIPSPKVERSLRTLVDSLSDVMAKSQSLYEEILSLIPDFEEIREILAKRKNRSRHVKTLVEKWAYKLQSRLKRRNLEYDPSNLKWKLFSHDSSNEEAWQQWIRLVESYKNGLFAAYDNEELEFTNNAKEQLFHRSKHHFRALLGRENVSKLFYDRASLYSQLLDVDYSKKSVSSILLACETPLTESQRRSFTAQYATIKRTWRIREEETGNIARFKKNLMNLGRA